MVGKMISGYLWGGGGSVAEQETVLTFVDLSQILEMKMKKKKREKPCGVDLIDLCHRFHLLLLAICKCIFLLIWTIFLIGNNSFKNKLIVKDRIFRGLLLTNIFHLFYKDLNFTCYFFYRFIDFMNML